MRNPSDKTKLLEMLKDMPNVSVACKRLGIAKATFYRWKVKDKKFETKVDDALDKGRESISDLAEGKLFGLIQKGEPWAIRYYLNSNSKRYLQPRRPFALADELYRGVASITYEMVPSKKQNESNDTTP